jgi:hypothetical protein
MKTLLILTLSLVTLCSAQTPTPTPAPGTIQLGAVVLIILPDGSIFSGPVEEISPSGDFLKIRDEMPNRDMSDLRWVPKTAIKEQLQPRT